MERKIDLKRLVFITDMQLLSDGNFIACGDTITKDIGYVDFFYHRSYLMKFDIEGNIIWSRQYGKEGPVNAFMQIEVLQGDTLIVAGHLDTCYVHNMGLDYMFQLYKIAPNGEVIWGRYINLFKKLSQSDNVTEALQSFIHTRDGGYALTGFINYRDPDPFVLVKTDAEGCVTENCENIAIGIAGADKEEDGRFSIYPNPASDQIYFEFKNAPASAATFEILDLTGRRMETLRFKGGEQRNYPANKLPNGIYFIRLSVDNQFVETRKIVINH